MNDIIIGLWFAGVGICVWVLLQPLLYDLLSLAVLGGQKQSPQKQSPPFHPTFFEMGDHHETLARIMVKAGLAPDAMAAQELIERKVIRASYTDDDGNFHRLGARTINIIHPVRDMKHTNDFTIWVGKGLMYKLHVAGRSPSDPTKFRIEMKQE